MHATEADGRRAPVPLRALLISALALAVPVVGQLVLADPAAELDVLLWLLALIPAFLFGYHRGWRGAAAALAAGMVALTLTQVVLLLSGRNYENWPLFLTVVGAYVAAALAVGWVSELLHRERRRAEGLAMIDDLTSLPNRRFARRFLDIEVAAAQRGRKLSLVMIDIDRFKEYNDRFGHPAGDRALVAMARALDRNTRRMDLAARWGGEEFVVVLSDTGDEGAVTFVDRVRNLLRESPTEGEPITFSAGIATFASGARSPDDLIDAADRALYRAKSEGRDRSVVAHVDAEGQFIDEPAEDLATTEKLA